MPSSFWAACKGIEGGKPVVLFRATLFQNTLTRLFLFEVLFRVPIPSDSMFMAGEPGALGGAGGALGG